MKDNKIFIIPTIEIIEMNEDDILTGSNLFGQYYDYDDVNDYGTFFG